VVTVILRIFCVAVASVVGAAYVCIIGGGLIAVYLKQRNAPPSAEPEVGWDLIASAHDYPVAAQIILGIALVVFVIVFLISFRHFSKSVSRP
jgi:hypothetical protein